MIHVETEKNIREITDIITQEYSPEKIILFGSFAWGKPHEDSDVDLLVVMESGKSRFERQQDVLNSIRSLGVPVDVLVYTPAELEESINKNRNLFLEDVVRNGKVLYAKSNVPFVFLYEPAELITL